MMEPNEDISELESLLYARVHHDTSAPFETATASSPLPFRQVSRNTVVNDISSSNHQTGRYWSGGGGYSNNELVLPVRLNVRNDAKPIMGLSSITNALDTNNVPATVTAPNKALPSYSSLLSEIGMNVNNRSASTNNSSGQQKVAAKGVSPILNTSTPKTKPAKNKKPRLPKNKPQLTNMLSPINPLSRKIINPFCNAYKKAAKLETIKRKRLRTNQNRAKNAARNIDTIVLDDSEDGANDDVIEIPVPPPPLVSLDSSDESLTAPTSRDQFVIPTSSSSTAVRFPRQDGNGSRCVSPTSSIMSDDFIGQRERQRLDESLDDLQAAVEQELQRTQPIEAAKSKSAFKKVGQSKVAATSDPKSYEVGENSFAAVDVYESENSDMPDSVYDRGNTAAKQSVPDGASESDEEDRIDVVKKKKKKLRKTRSTGSTKSSEYNTSDEEMMPSDSDEDNCATSLPFIVRGDAVGNNLHAGKTKRKKVRHLSENHSDQEFMSILSSMGADSGNEEENADTSTEMVGAIELVKHVIAKGQSRQEDSVEEPEPPVASDEPMEAETNAVDDNNSSDEDLLAVEWNVLDEVSDKEDSDKEGNDVEVIEKKIDCVEVSSDEADKIELNISGERCLTVAQRRRRINDKKSMGLPPLLRTDRRDPAEFAWNEEMRRFYHDHWDGATFDMQKLIKSMDSTPSKWRISAEDRRPQRRFGGRYQNICENCNERGHNKLRCRYGPKKLVCIMCGQEGHREPRCPNSICLGCGSPSRVFGTSCGRCASFARAICSVCNIRGHRSDSCPDKWRRYHSTTQPNAPLVRDNHRQNPIKACCICASMTHYTDDCHNARRILTYPVQTTRIQSYSQSYNHVPVDHTQERYVVLATAGGDDMRFDWNETTKQSPFYRRFREAVGLGDIQNESVKRVKKKKKPVKEKTVAQIPRISVSTNTDEPQIINNPVKRKQLTRVAPSSSPKIHASSASRNSSPSVSNTSSSKGELSNPQSTMSTHRSRPPPELSKTSSSIVTKSDNSKQLLIEVEKNAQPTFFINPMNPENIVTSEKTKGIDLKRRAEKLKLQENELSSKLLRVAEKIRCTKDPSVATDEEHNINEPKVKSSISHLAKVAELLRNSQKTTSDEAPYDDNPYNNPSKRRNSGEPSSPEKAKKIFNKQFYAEDIIPASANETISRSHSFSDEQKNLMYSLNPESQSPTKSFNIQTIQSCPPSVPNPPALIHDSDSNYSFSEYYDCNRPPVEETYTDNFGYGDDFIPLSPPDDTMERYDEVSDIEVVSIAKVYVGKPNLKLLLTERGMKYREESSKRYNVETEIKNTLAGNVLLIEGTQQNQAAFHANLKDFFNQVQSENERANNLSCIPKKRESLIKFIRINLQQLDNKLTNPHKLIALASRNESPLSKQVKRARKELNMIFFGQAGMHEGRMHLDCIQNVLKQLIEGTQDELVTIELREKINTHLNYIFSPTIHTEFGRLLDKYNTMCKMNKLPKPNLNRKLVGFNIQIKPMTQIDGRDKEETNFNNRPVEMLNTSNQLSHQCTNKPPITSADGNLLAQLNAMGCQRALSITQTFSQLVRPLMQKFELTARSKQSSFEPSDFWSQQCLVLLDDLLKSSFCMQNAIILDNLKKIRTNGQHRQLSHSDFKLIVSLQKDIQSVDFTHDVVL